MGNCMFISVKNSARNNSEKNRNALENIACEISTKNQSVTEQILAIFVNFREFHFFSRFFQVSCE